MADNSPRHPNNPQFVPLFPRGQMVIWDRVLGKRNHSPRLVPTPAVVLSCGPKHAYIRYELVGTIRFAAIAHEALRMVQEVRA